MARPPSLTPRKVVRILKQHGFQKDHQTASHLVMRNPQTGQRAVVPIHTKDLPRGTMLAILRSAGIEL